MSTYSLYTDIHINASPEAIWKVFFDFKSYSEWNPFIEKIEGLQTIGEGFKVRLGGMNFSPKLLELTPAKKLVWKGRLLLSGIFDGTHHFELIPQENGGTLFIQKENFSGILVPFLRKKLERETLRDFQAMNEALKKRVENSESE